MDACVEFSSYFGKYAMSQYPPADERQYAHVVDYRRFQVASYLSDDPIYVIGGMPIHELFFVIDDMGDNVLPEDLPMGSYFQATALIDYFHFLNSNPKWKQKNKDKDVWTVVGENQRMSNRLGDMMVFFRELELFAKHFDADSTGLGDDPEEFKKELCNRLGHFLGKIPGWTTPAQLIEKK